MAGRKSNTSARRVVPDQHFLDLYRAHEELTAVAVAAQRAADEAYIRAKEKFPARPRKLLAGYSSGDGTKRFYPLTHDDLDQWFEHDLMRSKGWEERKAKWHAELSEWEAKEEAIKAEHGVPELQAKAEALWAEVDRTAEEIISTPAASVLGISIKLKLAVEYDDCLQRAMNDPEEGDFHQNLVVAAMRDAERLAVRRPAKGAA